MRARFASDTAGPPRLAFRARQVALDIPCLQPRSVTILPASTSFTIPAILSAVNRVRSVMSVSCRRLGLERQLEQITASTFFAPVSRGKRLRRVSPVMPVERRSHRHGGKA